MTPHFLDQIDWQRPWLELVRTNAAPILAAADRRVALNAQAAQMDMRNHRDLALQFVAQSDLPPDMGYEAYISATGNIPTRENLHDFFNALVWLTFPKIKRQLNALQAAEITRRLAAADASQTGTNVRGKLRDAATIFDENAALLVTSNTALASALRNHQWHQAFVVQRPAFGRECEIFLFGHALMEKLTSPYKAITAHAWLVIVEQNFFALSRQEQAAELDAAVADQLNHGLATSDFSPLPVLGVPGWWVDQDAGFYGDAAVFRPKRPMV